MDYRVVYINAQAIFAIMFIVLYVLERINRRGQMPRKLDILYVLFMISLILDSTWILIDGRPELRSYNLILNLVYIAMLSGIGYVWFLYTLDIFPSSTRLHKLKFILVIPVIINVVMVLSSPKTGLVFTIDDSGTYVRAPFHMVSLGINYTYMLLGTYAALVARKEAQLTSDKRRLAVAAIFPLPIFVLVFIQVLLPPGLPAFQGGVMISLLLLYSVYQRVLVTRDPLTSLPNRYAFETDLVERISSYRKGNHLYLMEGDLDGFKKINDTMGHPMGDHLLKITADVLTRVFSKYGSLVFRHGGDEFMIIVETDEELDVDEIRKDLNSQLSKTADHLYKDLGMSLGIVEFKPEHTLKSLIEEVDKDLYKVKLES